MNRYLENRWLRNAALLGALVAGGLMTQLIPTYEELASLRNKPMPPAAESPETSPRDMTGIDVDQRQLRFVQYIA
jgi:hypothetical protein